MQVKDRKKIDQKYKWKLEDIFKDNALWEECYFATEERLPLLNKYQDTLSNNDKLFDCLTLSSLLSHDISKLYQYARMRKDENTRDDLYQSMSDRAEILSVKYGTSASFITPEISEFSIEKLENLKHSTKFEDYSCYFQEIIRNKNIILSKKEEKLLQEVGIFSENSDEVFSMFDNADIKFEPIQDEKGKKVELSHGVYSLMMQNKSQEVRKSAFESMFTAYKTHINTLATNYAGNVKKDWFFSKIRGFGSSLDFSMYSENVSPLCYKKLLEAVSDGTKILHRYVALRKKALNVDVLNMYDLYVPIVSAKSLNMNYEQASETVKNALKVMGSEYHNILASAFTDGWIDVFETKNKRSGAYSWGSYGIHPFVLLNYQPTVHDIFTIAHELGHAMHSFFSNKNQPEQKAGYEIFVAEIASTVNEVLLLKYLMKSAEGEFKKYLLSYYLDMFRTTVFRQTMFAEFEQFAHSAVEQSQPITAETLSNAYYALNKKYYGKAVKHNELIRYEWARIPHFYSSFYVYKYATGLISAVTIANNILKCGEKYYAKYKKFLSAGGSLPPLDILRLADVDLETNLPYDIAMKEFADTLKELEKEL